MKLGSVNNLFLILTSVVIVSIGYGVSFPLLSISLERMGVTSSLIGLNAAMPALGWLLISFFLPKLHNLFSVRNMMLGFLAIAFCGLIGFTLIQDFLPWLLFRFMFGGGLGMFFRVVEYWLNTATEEQNRGRIMGIYSVCFLVGIIIGSILQPNFGTQGFMPYGIIALSLALCATLLIMVNLSISPDGSRKESCNINPTYLRQLFRVVPIAMAGIIAYGLFEDVPAYLLSVYALKAGFPEDIAAYTLTAVALGNVIFAIPLGMLSDKIGRLPILSGSAIVGCIGAVLIPFTLSNTIAFLSVLVIWGGCIGSIYIMSLSVIGDKFQGHNLISANATFGIFYAAAALIGPILNGVAMQLWEPNGLMVSCGLIFGIFLIFALSTSRTKAIRDAI